MKRRLSIVAATVIIVAVGCATVGRVNPILATGEVLRTAAREFNTTAALYDRLYCVGRDAQGTPTKLPGCRDRITEAEYRAFAHFAERFRPAHRAARAAWKAAALASDAQGAARAADALDAVRAELLDLLLAGEGTP